MNNSIKSFLPFGLNIASFFAIVFLIIIYAVGIVGIGIFNNQQIISLTPLNLMISLGIIIGFHEGSWKKLIAIIFICFTLGLLVEMLGVQTGMVFGQYEYGPVLGPKILNTPIMIGVNWAMLIYSIGSTVNLFFPTWKFWFKAIYGAISMVILDYFIEPVAIVLNFWNWSETVVPIQNYIAWGVISFLLFLIFFRSFEKESNKVAYALFILQCLFFGILNLLLNF